MHKQIIMIVNNPNSATKKSLSGNQDDLFKHVLTISRNGQDAMDGCHGQVFFF